MRILDILKADLRDERDRWAHGYREIRKENPAKDRLLFRRLQAAKAITEAVLQSNVMTR